ncbi:STAS domain-containing protein [Streptomyces sp. MS1.AVA.1]|uniref:STAS domain-containing protein n=1 Tax=Streptomyces machairae TaxID=3134109 RepID=A0ABU8UF54_9ACTN
MVVQSPSSATVLCKEKRPAPAPPSSPSGPAWLINTVAPRSHAAPTRPRTVDSPAYGLRQALDATAPPGPGVVADMSGVSFMDSTGINILITVHRDLAEAGGRLRLAAPTGPVLHTIRLVGIDTVIDCHDTLRQGLPT